MINNCKSKNPLLRDGTSQQQRLLKALLPGYVSVDERSMDDLVKFARDYSKEIRYYGPDDMPNGDWYDFFTKDLRSDQRTEPHYALFIAFLELFRVAQDDLNTVTGRHLEFYYKDVLRIKEEDAIPDQVYIIFDLAKEVNMHLIAKGTVLVAGKDKSGKDLYYKTDKDIVVNKSKVKELKALYRDTDAASLKYLDRLYASPVANSKDGLGMELDGTEPKWRTFGRPATGEPARAQASVGFAVSSPVLALHEGKRTITLSLRFAEAPTVIASYLQGYDLRSIFRVMFSGEKKWIDTGIGLAQTADNDISINQNTIEITRTLTENDPGIVTYNESILNDAIEAKWPVAKVLINNESNLSPYHALKNLTLLRVEVTVEVKGVKNLILQNDFGDLDPAKPFQPFTSRPVIGSSFYIGSREVFSKRLSSLAINIDWENLPRDFATYYDSYVEFAPTNQSFKVDISLLDSKKWKGIKTDALFDATLDDIRMINITSPIESIPGDPGMEEITELGTQTKKGFLRMNLTGSDFGHQEYHHSFVTRMMERTKMNTTSQLPRQPYTPVMKSVSIDYTSSAVIDFASQAGTQAGFDNRIDQYFHMLPFGVAEVHKLVTGTVIPLLPVFNDQGALYIGIESLEPSQIISLLFKVAEGSADPDLLAQEIKWSYLSDNRWIDFLPFSILSDTTNGLLTTGIISFDIPKAASSNNTVLTKGLHWLRASVAEDSAAVCDLIAITAQAVTATFDDRDNDAGHLQQSLPALTIKELYATDALVETTAQPYASFGGRMKEQGADFYMRVSERLRHKHRAITIWDYEHLVLERFPSIYKVKCLNHTWKGFDENDAPVYSEIAPGHVTLITVSNLRNKNVVNPLRPKTSLAVLEEVKDYISALNPPCAQLHVVNPFFEEIQLRFNVKFRNGYDKGFYAKKLEEDIKQFLAPWAYNSTDIVIGGKIHSSVIINFIDEREYVDFIACFSMDQATVSGVLPNVEEAAPTTASSVLTSAGSHMITVLESDDCECSDNEVIRHNLDSDNCECETTEASIGAGNSSRNNAGVGVMTVGGSLIIGAKPDTEGIDFMQIDNDFDIL